MQKESDGYKSMVSRVPDGVILNSKTKREKQQTKSLNNKYT